MARTSQKIDTTNHDVGQSKPREFVGDVDLNESQIETVDSPTWKDKAAALAFENEMVTVNVHETTAPNTHPIVEIWVDGRIQRFERGRNQTVKRKYVYGLCRAKKTSFSQEKIKDANGDDTYRYPSRTALIYPFTLVEDTQKGREWLKRALLEA